MTDTGYLHRSTTGRLAPVLAPRWATPRRDNPDRCSRSFAGADEPTSLGSLAFSTLRLLVFAIPWEDAVIIPGFGTAARLIGIPAIALGAMAAIERGRVRRPGAAHLVMTLFVLWAAVSYLWSVDPEGTLVQVFTYIRLLMMVWLIWEFSCRGRDQLRLMQAYILGTFITGIDTVYLFLSHQQTAYQRYAGASTNANDLGLIMALSIPASHYLLIQSKGRMVWVYRLQLVLAGATVLLTASRGAALASIVALAIVPLTYVRLQGRQRIAILLTEFLLAGGALLSVPSSSWERLFTIPNEFAHGTLTGRTVIWTAGWELFRLHPFLGVGAAAFRSSVSSALSEPSVAHNTFLSVLVEQGVIGFTLFCALIGVLALSVSTMPPVLKRLWIVTLAVWMVGVCSLTWETRKPTWFFFGLLIAQCGAVAHKRQRGHVPGLAETQATILRASRP